MKSYPDSLQISEPEWPQDCTALHPGDLSEFVPQGLGRDGADIATPYSASGTAYYGFDVPKAHPLLDAPTTESNGGTFYFDQNVADDQLRTALRIAGVFEATDYVAYASSSSDPKSDRYLDQLRIVSIDAMLSLYKMRSTEPPPKQTLFIGEALLGFVDIQKRKWNEQGRIFSSKLRGTAAATMTGQESRWGSAFIWRIPIGGFVGSGADRGL